MLEIVKSPSDKDGDDICLVFQGNRLITDMRSTEPALLAQDQVASEGWRIEQRQFIGRWQGRDCYALGAARDQQFDPMRYHCGHLLGVLGRVPDEQFDLLGRAVQLLSWERDNRHCGRCGQSMQRRGIDPVMACDACGFSAYPRIAPCAITLVTKGDEVLLARSVEFPDGFFSALAGFVEAGESVEQCLIREVREEVGLEVANPRYVASQPWAFPGQLMLGFFCDYVGGDICCDPAEIAEAHWFKADNLPPIPPAQAIAGQLIRRYFKNLGV